MTIVKRRIVRLFLDRDLGPGTLPLDEREAHYVGNVLRLRRGEQLTAFNGRGAEWTAVLDTLTRRGAALQLLEPLEPLPESPLALTLVQALVKADAMDWIVQKATELGVRSIAPVYAEFSVVKLDGERSERRVEHWSRIAQSACEQSGRHVPPAIHAPLPLAERLATLPPGEARLALVRGATLGTAALPQTGRAAIVAVGPEGGWGAADRSELGRAQFVSVDFGPRMLRADTAAVAACAVLQQRWGDI